MIGLGAIIVGLGMSGVVVFAATQDQAGGVDIWTLLEKGGAPMAGGLLLVAAELYRQLQRAYKIIESKDATILALSTRQTSVMETTNDIANDQITIARSTENLLRELVTLLRGKLDIG